MKNELEFPHVVPHSAQQKPGLHRGSGCKMTRALLRTEILRESHMMMMSETEVSGEDQRNCAAVGLWGEGTEPV